MKKTIIAVACAAFISTGAMAKPASHNAPKPHNGHTVHMVDNHAPKPAPHKNHKSVHHTSHHRPAPVVAYVRPTPPPPPHHHHHYDAGTALLGDVIIAFAILASNAM